MRINTRNIIKTQRGFTAIELLIGIALIGVIGGAIATSVAQTFSGTNISNNHETAINNVRNAGDWITRDAQMARVADSVVGSGILGDPPDEIRLSWYDYDPAYPQEKWHIVVYTIPAGTTDLTRVETIDGDTGTPVVVAQNITNVTREFIDCVWSTGDPITCEKEINTLTITITSTVGSGTYEASEQRTFEIQMRPKK